MIQGLPYCPTRKRFSANGEWAFAWISHLGRSSTSEEVQEEHHYTDDQQNVNEACGNVKGQATKEQLEPRRLIQACLQLLLSLSACQSEIPLSHTARIPTSCWIRAWYKAARLEN